MNVWSKVLVVLNLLFTLGFLWLALATLNTQQHWRTQVNRNEAGIEQQVNGQPSQAQLHSDILSQRVKLDQVTLDRGRVWTNVGVKTLGEDGSAALVVATPDPNQLAPNMIVYAFALSGWPPNEGAYLGRFKVAGVGEGGSVAIEPMTNLAPAELQRLNFAGNQGNWTLFEVLPSDENDLFDSLTPEQRRQVLPAELVNEYERHGQPAQATDPEVQVLNGNFQRIPRDYSVLLRQYERQITAKRDEIVAGQADLAAMQTTIADAQRQIEYRRNEIVELQAELDESTAERDLIVAHREALDAELAQTDAAIGGALASAKRNADLWDQKQMAAAAEIDRRAPPVP